MNDLQKLITRFDEILALEKDVPLHVLGSYIIGAIIVRSYELYENNVLVQEIDNLANKLEVQDGTPEQLQQDWNAIKARVKTLKDSDLIN